MRTLIQDPAASNKAAPGPFIHKFRTKAHYYVYDVNQNTVFRLRPVEFAILDEIAHLGEDAIVRKHSRFFSTEEVISAYGRLVAIRARANCFSTNRPSRIVYPLDEHSLKKLYDERLSTLILSVTEQCNLRCEYCVFSGAYRYNRKHSSKVMSITVAKSAINFLKEHSELSERVHIGFYGGEPLLRPQFVEQCIEYARNLFGRKVLSFGMTTNGTCLTEHVCDILLKYDIELLVSLDGPAVMHDRYRKYANGKPTFNTIKLNLERLKQINPDYYRRNVSFNMMMTPPYDFLGMREFIDNSLLLKENQFRLGFLSNRYCSFFDRFTKSDLNADALTKHSQDYVRSLASGAAPAPHKGTDRLSHQLFLQNLEFLCWQLVPSAPLPGTYHPGGICIPGERRLFVSSNGKLFPCERVNSTSDIYCLGSIERGLDASKALRGCLKSKSE